MAAGKLLLELNEDTHTLVEEADGQKRLFIEGVFMQFDHVNKNKRRYPARLMANVHRYINEYVDQNRAYGELDHPSGPKVNMKNVSHRVVVLKENGKNFYGKALVADTPMGAIVRGLISDGGKIGVSSRAVGSVKNMGPYVDVQEDFTLSAIDTVADPSAHQAFCNSLYESREWVWNNGIWEERDLSAARNALVQAPSRKLTETSLAIFHRFFNARK